MSKEVYVVVSQYGEVHAVFGNREDACSACDILENMSVSGKEYFVEDVPYED